MWHWLYSKASHTNCLSMSATTASIRLMEWQDSKEDGFLSLIQAGLHFSWLQWMVVSAGSWWVLMLYDIPEAPRSRSYGPNLGQIFNLSQPLQDISETISIHHYSLCLREPLGKKKVLVCVSGAQTWHLLLPAPMWTSSEKRHQGGQFIPGPP